MRCARDVNVTRFVILPVKSSYTVTLCIHCLSQLGTGGPGRGAGGGVGGVLGGGGKGGVLVKMAGKNNYALLQEGAM